jgi:hypothetical protein
MPKRKPHIPVVVIQSERQLTTSEVDQPSLAVRLWAANAVKELKQNPRLHIVPLLGPKATRHRIESELSKIKRKKGLVVFYGHGCICGESLFENQAEVDEPMRPALSAINVELLENKIVYAVACYSAKTLGPYAVNNTGVLSYIGYTAELATGADSNGPIAALGECVNSGLTVLTEDGGTCLDARDKIYRTFTKWINLYDAKDTFDDYIHAIAFAIGRHALVEKPLGDHNARLI